MRVLMTVSIPTPAGNKAIQENRVGVIMETAMNTLKPEAAYFLPVNGKRTALFVFDLADPSMLPSVSEPFFAGLDAEISVTPVMNAADMQAGLKKIAR